MQYTETQLTKLIEDVEREFTSHLAKAEDSNAPLAKAEEGDKKPFEKKPEDKEAAPEAKPEAEAKPEEGAPEAKPEEGKAPEAAAVAPAGPAADAPGAPAAEHDYDQEDLNHLEKMYMSMSEGERKVHHDAIMKCAGSGCGSAPSQPMIQKSELNAHPENAPSPKDNAKAMDNDPANGGIEGQEPHNSPGAKSPASDSNGAKINKSEAARRNGGKIEAGNEPKGSPGAKSPASKEQGTASMEKSELGTETELLKSELSTVNAKYDDLKKNFDAVAAFLTKFVEKKPAPAAKAVTSLDVIAKSEGANEEVPLNKAEIDSKLLAKSQDVKTSKSDRDAINAFYLGSNDIKGISHLLK